MLIITDADIRLFAASLVERECSPATITKYAHDLRLLTDYAPDGIPDKAALVGFRAYLTERGYAPSSVNSILGHSSIDTIRIYTARSGREERRQLGQLRLIL